MADSIRWGIIGMGKIARKFAEDLRRAPGAQLYAVASTAYDRARAFADEFGAEHAYGAYEDILTCPDLDVVYVATPHSGHFAATMMCLNAGIPVLCEKPFAMHHGEAQQMVDLARQKGVFLMEALWTRFVPAFVKAMELVQEGRIGAVHTVRADFGFRAPFDPEWRIFNKKLGGGSLLDIGIYPALLSLTLFGAPEPDQIQATATYTQTEVDESCHFIFRYPNNKLAIGYSTIAATTPVDGFIHGDLGTIQFHPRWHNPHGFKLSLYDGFKMTHEDINMPYEGWGYQFEAIHVMECLRAGRTESPVVPLDFTLDLIKTLDAIRSKIGLEY